MQLKRQTDTCYPAYLAYVGKKAVCWVEQAAGRRNGWSVHLCGTTPGDEKSQLLWFGDFKQAKVYARELCELQEIRNGQN